MARRFCLSGSGSPRISPSSSWNSTAIPRNTLGMLHSCDRPRIEAFGIFEPEQQSVLSIPDDRHDPYRPFGIGRELRLRILVFGLRSPPAEAGRGAHQRGDGVLRASVRRSIIMARNTMLSATSKPKPVSSFTTALYTSSPSPPAPIRAVMITIPTDIMIAWFNPSMMEGSAKGSCTL